MKFCFRKLTDDSGSIPKLICLGSGGPLYHSETWFADGRFFSALYETGVRFANSVEHLRADGTLDPDYWITLDLPARWSETPAILDWCQSIDGAPYDLAAAFNSAFGIGIRDPNKWFCSLTTHEVGSRAGMPLPTAMPCPLRLYRETMAALDRDTVESGLSAIVLDDSDRAVLHRLLQAGSISATHADLILERAKQ